MEKLIELLNQFEKARIKKINSEGKLMVKLSFKPYTKEILTNKAYRSCWLEICSKYYGFIQGLIEKDKIDIGKIKKLYRKANEHSIHTYPIMYEYSDYETLLMLLSISDSPILDLISMLK